MTTMTNPITSIQMTCLPTTKLLVIIDGPTASGKTKLGVELAQHYSTEIISADSRQFYKEMRIGTARPSEEELEGIQHHFLAFTSIEEDINAGKYERIASEKINQLFKSHDLVIVVGGSGFYIDALLFGIDDIPPILPEVRAKMIAEYDKRGLEHIQKLLLALDPELYQTIDIQNPKRIIRGLEVVYQTGKKLSHFQLGSKIAKWPYLRIGIDWDRELLYERINLRVDEMIKHGLEKEAREMYPFRHLNALKTVGYSELFRYFEGEYDFDTAISMIKQNTRRYAKRQLTWLRNQSDTNWFEASDLEKMTLLIEDKRSHK